MPLMRVPPLGSYSLCLGTRRVGGEGSVALTWRGAIRETAAPLPSPRPPCSLPPLPLSTLCHALLHPTWDVVEHLRDAPGMNAPAHGARGLHVTTLLHPSSFSHLDVVEHLADALGGDAPAPWCSPGDLRCLCHLQPLSSPHPPATHLDVVEHLTSVVFTLLPSPSCYPLSCRTPPGCS